MAGNNEMKWVLVILSLLFLLCLLALPAVVLADTDITVTASSNYTGVPLVTCGGAVNITAISAVLVGNITHTGGANATTRGFEWGNSTGNYTLSWNETGDFSTGVFYHEITGLTPEEEVFWRAFAVNGYGQGNSTECSFIAGSGLPLAPTNFTIERIGTNSINASWVMGIGSTSTCLRIDKIGYPTNVTEGYLAYNGTDTWVVIDGLELDTSQYFCSAWGENSYGFSEDYAEAKIGGDTVIVIAFVVVALFFMWLSLRTRQLLVCLATTFIWLALSLWLFFSNVGFFDLSEGYVKILTYVFFIVAFIPLIWSTDQEIKHEAQGKTWTTYGTPPSGKGPSSSDKYRAELRRRIRGGQ